MRHWSFIRLFDGTFSWMMCAVRSFSWKSWARRVFGLRAAAPMTLISRDPADLVGSAQRTISTPMASRVSGNDVRAAIVDREAPGRIHSQARRYRARLRNAWGCSKTR